MSLSSIYSEGYDDLKPNIKTKKQTRKFDNKPEPFVEEDPFSDIVVVVEGQRLYTSRTLLSMSSPVLTRMLQSQEFKDKREVPLTGKTYDHILELLYILHPAYQRKLSG